MAKALFNIIKKRKKMWPSLQEKQSSKTRTTKGDTPQQSLPQLIQEKLQLIQEKLI